MNVSAWLESVYHFPITNYFEIGCFSTEAFIPLKLYLRVLVYQEHNTHAFKKWINANNLIYIICINIE